MRNLTKYVQFHFKFEQDLLITQNVTGWLQTVFGIAEAFKKATHYVFELVLKFINNTEVKRSSVSLYAN